MSSQQPPRHLLPKERIILNTDTEVSGLNEIEGVRAVNRHEYGYEVHITKLDTAKQILSLAMAHSAVNRFEIMEPTLNEIFIKAVGGEQHE